MMRNDTELAHHLFDIMNRRDTAALEAFLDDDAVFDFPGAPLLEGRRRIVTFLRALWRKYPRLEFSVEEVIAQDGRASVVWSNQGQRADGAAYRNRGVTLLHRRGDRAVLLSDYFKDTSFTQS